MVFWSGFIKKIKNAVTKERVDKLEQKINTNATNIELIEQDVETNTTNIGTIRNEMIMLKQEDNNIKRRLEQAETNITQTNNELDSLEANVNGFDSRITELESKNIKSAVVELSQFTAEVNNTANNMRYQTYYYDYSNIEPNLTRNRIVSVVDFSGTSIGYTGGMTSIVCRTTSITLWVLRIQDTSEFKMNGYVKVYYI